MCNNNSRNATNARHALPETVWSDSGTSVYAFERSMETEQRRYIRPLHITNNIKKCFPFVRWEKNICPPSIPIGTSLRI